LNTDCPDSTCGGSKKCVGGPYGLPGSERACTAPQQCNGCNPNFACTAAGMPVTCCTGNRTGTCPVVGSCALIQGAIQIRVPLNGICLPRSFPPGDVDCVTDLECHTCTGGANNGMTCKSATDCPDGACSGSGVCQLDSLDLTSGTANANGERPLGIPQASLILNPAVVSGIGAVCVRGGGNGVGVIDCDGGRAGLNAKLSRDHNTTPKVCLGGTKAGQACTRDSNCPSGICNLGNSGPAVGFPDDPNCTNTFTLPTGGVSRACLEGTMQCSGGSNDGTICTSNSNCTGGGSCDYCNIGADNGVSNGGPHKGVCNSPNKIEFSGTYAPGDLSVGLPLGITLLAAPAPTPPANWGADHLPCTADDPVAPAPPVSVALSSGTNSIFIYDVGNSPDASIMPGGTCAGLPCIADVTGKGLSCANLDAGNLSGTTFGGGFPALETPAGDIATIFQFIVQ
jgi:hypothetical protein